MLGRIRTQDGVDRVRRGGTDFLIAWVLLFAISAIAIAICFGVMHGASEDFQQLLQSALEEVN